MRTIPARDLVREPGAAPSQEICPRNGWLQCRQRATERQVETQVGRLVSPSASNAQVRAVMRGNRARDTGPELAVRRLLTAKGLRYRLHRKGLPGRPDIVLPSRKKAIFVHGCFWHHHSPCPLARPIKSNLSYWSVKLTRNKLRDLKNRRSLRRRGWKVLIIWECQLRDTTAV